MSQATKRKHVVKEVLGDYVAPTQSQQIVKVGDDFIYYLEKTDHIVINDRCNDNSLTHFH